MDRTDLYKYYEELRCAWVRGDECTETLVDKLIDRFELSKESLKRNKKSHRIEYSCEVDLWEIIAVRNNTPFLLPHFQSVIYIENEKCDYCIIRHATISDKMKSFFEVGKDFDLIITRKMINVEYGEQNYVTKRIKNAKLIQFRIDSELGSIAEYKFAFKTDRR